MSAPARIRALLRELDEALARAAAVRAELARELVGERAPVTRRATGDASTCTPESDARAARALRRLGFRGGGAAPTPPAWVTFPEQARKDRTT